MNWLRRHLCHWFKLVPRENYEAVGEWRMREWEDVLSSKDVDPVWPIVANSEIWTRHLLPAYRKMLVQTLFMLAQELDEQKKRDLQVQARLINWFLEEPNRAIRHDEILRERQYQSGELDDLIGVANGRR